MKKEDWIFLLSSVQCTIERIKEGETNCDKMDKVLAYLQAMKAESLNISMLGSTYTERRNKGELCAELLPQLNNELQVIYRLHFNLPEPPPTVAHTPWQLCPKCNGDKQVFHPSCTGPIVCDMCYGQGKILMHSSIV